MSKKSPAIDTVPAIALDLAAERGWRGLSLGEVAARAGLPLTELVQHFPAKSALLDAYFREIDSHMLAAGPELDGPARDRLFEVLMRRFEAMAPRRATLAAIVRAGGGDPVGLARGAIRLAHSMALALETAGLSSSGLGGVVRIKGLAGAYLYAARAFLDDDSADLGATMAALDRALNRIDHLARLVFDGRRRTADTAEPTAPH
jgi:AcrR family transcriptional regulator